MFLFTIKNIILINIYILIKKEEEDEKDKNAVKPNKFKITDKDDIKQEM